MIDPVVAAVCAEMQARSRHGVRKYGTMLDRTDLDRRAWVRHALEEAMDLTLYLRRILAELGEPLPVDGGEDRPGEPAAHLVGGELLTHEGGDPGLPVP